MPLYLRAAFFLFILVKKETMKLLVGILSMIVLFSCGTTQSIEGGEEVMDEAQVQKVERVLGVVHLNLNKCAVLIEISEGDETVYLAPTNLEDKFRVEGMKLKFDYIPTTVGQNLLCADSQPVMVEEVSVMR